MKKFLIVNTAGAAVEAATSDGGFFRDENSRNASVALMPAVDRLLEKSGGLSGLDFIACVTGPGSFTGIRIGVSTVRALCYACGKPALGINYLQMLAYNERADGCESILCVCDASNGLAYVCEFDKSRQPLFQIAVEEYGAALDRAKAYGGAVCVDEKFAALLPNAIEPAKDCSTLIRAANALCDRTCRYSELLPVYVRQSQAERDFVGNTNA